MESQASAPAPKVYKPKPFPPLLRRRTLDYLGNLTREYEANVPKNWRKDATPPPPLKAKVPWQLKVKFEQSGIYPVPFCITGDTPGVFARVAEEHAESLLPGEWVSTAIFDWWIT